MKPAAGPGASSLVLPFAPMLRRRIAAVAAAIAGAIMSQACGFKGPLYLPADPPPAQEREQAPATKQNPPQSR